MPTDLNDVETGGTELVFPDDVEGTQFELTEAAVYEAEEVRSETGADEIPRFGRWMPVDLGDGEGAWMVALGELLDELKRFEAPTGNTFVVTRCEKSGSDDTDPYECNVEAVETDGQTGLPSS